MQIFPFLDEKKVRSNDIQAFATKFGVNFSLFRFNFSAECLFDGIRVIKPLFLFNSYYIDPLEYVWVANNFSPTVNRLLGFF